MQQFDFGANWDDFSAHLVDRSRLDTAKQSLRDLLQISDLRGMRILDVGCGSGLFALAAAELGAREVIGIDVNPRCIKVSERNRQALGITGNVTFQEGSALDAARMATLGTFELVYAWGSLHHTGAMWNAIRTVSASTTPGSLFVLGLYKKHWTSPIWLRIKWFYNQAPRLVQRLMGFVFAVLIYIAKFAVTRRNPLNKERGMSFWYDIIDWIGGYPYEYVTPDEVTTFLKPLGFTRRRHVPDATPTGIHEFVFERAGRVA